MLRIHRVQFTITLICSLAGASAQIPNAGFEDWVDQGDYLDPAGWVTSNDVMTPVPILTVEPGSPGAVDDHYALIITREITGTSGIIQGWMFAAPNNTTGFPYAARPAMLSGQWQHDIQPTDIGDISISLSKWNSSTMSTEVIAHGTTYITGTISDWQSFSVPFTYLSLETPDSAYIQIMSSNDGPSAVAGSFIKIDDLAFTGTVEVGEHHVHADFTVHPSPATDQLNVHTSISGELMLFDATRRTVLQTRITGPSITLDVSGFEPGLYFYQFGDVSGRQVIAGRWMKE